MRETPQAVEAPEVAAGDPRQRDEVVGGPEAVDVALSEPGASTQHPGVGALVANLDPGDERGGGRPEGEPAIALVELEPSASEAGESSQDRGAGEPTDHPERSGWGYQAAPLRRSRNACQ